ncbi:hypothetical protein PILCRDRAFT_816530 [Piloderma croceum F 1598]|uniref:Uncharacterized protein n=1 Tax=Piloderma croceum (strain F 1598) TaxID=765440 RepID=A0A0C3G287_PILCF|nr:hypothetical protein PILCRDRAFT_816530 [Piloderma croceum F 1598]
MTVYLLTVNTSLTEQVACDFTNATSVGLYQKSLPRRFASKLRLMNLYEKKVIPHLYET